MKTEEIRKLTVEAIEHELDDAREKLMRMRFQIATGELKDQNLPRMTRKDIARLMTILREKRAEQKTEGEA
ncbi:MAG TPA: 50S ribosomal protein L29 [Anaerolineales bacterium]|uniref:Large ribosomal subunit protein uL29 n=1 Tax=uncultured Chloroflexi bacterium Rifle_16ft_4_minimus_5165 TaxID=1665076 RepID=A0A0H4T951_9CHLR|nr:50S ribosomal protein L29, large subunit ribosomal protein L29 [uncultured Chloroflexi bacterium Rifle_16ft_4_minimus_5165]